jgi:arylsulfatase A-like enzyme
LFNNEDLVGIRTQRWKYVAFDYYRGHLISTDAKYPQLYDIAADSSESYSVADRYPEVLADMRARFAVARARFAGFKKGVPAVFRDFTPPGLVQPD